MGPSKVRHSLSITTVGGYRSRETTAGFLYLESSGIQRSGAGRGPQITGEDGPEGQCKARRRESVPDSLVLQAAQLWNE